MTEPHPTLPATAAALGFARGDAPAPRWGAAGADGGLGRGRSDLRWRDVVTSTRYLSLGLVEAGLGRGALVAVGDGPDRLALEQAVLAAGGTLVLEPTTGPTSAPGPVVAVDGSEVRIGSRPWALDELRTAGERVDAEEPDRFERLVAAVEPSWPAALAGGHTLTHAEVVDGLRSLDRWLGPLADGGGGRPNPTIVVVGSRTEVAVWVTAVWWPLLSGSCAVVASPASLLDVLREERPALVAAPADELHTIVGGIHAAPHLWRSRRARRRLALGRAAAAGDLPTPPERLQRPWLDRRHGRRLREAVGLDTASGLVSWGQPPEADRRALVAAGLPLVTTWLPAGVVGPACASAPAEVPATAGRPTPGRSVRVVDGARLAVEGPGVAGGRVVTPDRGWLDAAGRLRLRRRPAARAEGAGGPAGG